MLSLEPQRIMGGRCVGLRVALVRVCECLRILKSVPFTSYTPCFGHCCSHRESLWTLV